MDKYFGLTVAKGTIIWRADGSQQTLTEVPENALDIWEKGSRTLCLKKEGAELLEKFSKQKIQQILDLRRPLKYEAEIKILEKALKSPSTAPKGDKT